MKKLGLIGCLMILLGCSNLPDLQCDETYLSDYNCDLPQHNLFAPSAYYPPYYVRPTTYYPYPVTNNYYYTPPPTNCPPSSTEPREVIRVNKRPSIHTRTVRN